MNRQATIENDNVGIKWEKGNELAFEYCPHCSKYTYEYMVSEKMCITCKQEYNISDDILKFGGL